MFLKIKDNFVNFELLGKTKEEVLIFMKEKPVQLNSDLWRYTLDVSHFLKITVMFIEFEDNKACHLSTRVIYSNPLKKLMLWHSQP
ncbi:hypothetical protein [Chryseobacterium gleum]|uniref:hypothetical protein n=1 Tax=Chryseobacterium gleum TaxID=250 RepID=UPI0016286081|nr:hypothetical protein [Chryseobacterium gleum]